MIGTNTRVVLSPTPPVECLSTVQCRVAEVHPFTGLHHRRGPPGDLTAVHAAPKDRHQQCRHLFVTDLARGVGVDDPVDGGIGQPPAIALGPDHGRRVECEAGQETSPASRASRRQKASGSRSSSRRGPAGWSISNSGPPCSKSSCRHRPHGVSGEPCASTHASATSRPPPVECSAETTPHSAQRERPYETFSTLHPVTTRPSSTSAAAPTGKLEYGA